MHPIRILRTVDEVRAWRQATAGKIGFVPTMGALHEGHAKLLSSIRPRCDISVLSIFVNPTQFGPNEDLARYPRPFERDLEIARREGVDAVFAPTPELLYPPGYSTYVEETEISKPLCGAFRPGHFRGVTTVVLKLFSLIKPQFALFGLKDAQQFFVLHKMAHDLVLDIEVEGMATVREADGLALSSRNAYLSVEERAIAPTLYQTLREIRSPESLAWARDALTQKGFRVQYLECLELPSLQKPYLFEGSTPALVAAAVYLGSTRLVDNVILNHEKLTDYRFR